MKEKLRLFAIMPAVVLNLISILLFAGYYALQSQQPEVLSISESDLFFILYVVIVIVEWLFFGLLIIRVRTQGRAITSLLVRKDTTSGFRFLPALWMFLAFNGLFAGYMLFTEYYMGGWPGYSDWSIGQVLFMTGVVPLTAAITEEFIWRGYILHQLLQRTSPWRAIFLAALSFAFIHGVMPDRLLITFLLGVVAGYYYYREGRLLPLIFSHIVLDIWSFGVTARF